MRSRWTRGVAAALLLLAGCGDEPQGREETGLEALSLRDINPKIILPGSRLQLDGDSFLDRPLGISWLRLSGNYAGAPVDAYLPAEFVDFTHMEIDATAGILGVLGPPVGSFGGRVQVEVDFVPDGTRHASVPLTMSLEVAEHLEPQLDALDVASVIYVNEPIEVRGSGLLLGGDEGTTYAVVEGCFISVDDPVACTPRPTVEIPVTPAAPFDREHGVFPFSPSIAGIEAGEFQGRVTLRNDHPDGVRSSSRDQGVQLELRTTRVTALGDGEAVGTLGKYIDIQGDGFVDNDGQGGTVLRFFGEYLADEGPTTPVTFEVIPGFVDGRTVRYVINEEDGLASLVDVRQARGTFIGEVEPVVDYLDQEVVGDPTPVSVRLEPVKQVVYVKFNPTYVESLRLFGLRALDAQIRRRVLAVLERDYEAINVEFRSEPPQDYALYSIIEIAGPDPNGLGLLGYDNTPGKDTGNERLNDRIGGVNAQTLEDGFPGFGGVFMESLFTFSLHPPAGTVASSEVATLSFDEIFDPLRPDRGRPVTTDELPGLPVLETGSFCPGRDRITQISCAVFVLGSVVGSTVSHELGHSLGLADPLGQEFHNGGDLPNRLMDAGGARSFEERGELLGLGPSRFCVEAYEYLREILPTTELDPAIERPPC